MSACRRMLLSVAAVCALGAAAAGQTSVFPTGGHTGYEPVPFGSEQTTLHMVFDSALFPGRQGWRVNIGRIAFATDPSLAGQSWEMPVTIRMGYTDRQPGEPPPAGLDEPAAGTNADGPMYAFFESGNIQHTASSSAPGEFDLEFAGSSFSYNPARGNLLVEIVADGRPNASNNYLAVSAAAGGPESSLAYNSVLLGGAASPTAALRVEIGWHERCYPDCNSCGVLNFFDFLCFQDAFLAGHPYADCDQNGVLDFFDFLCFQNEFLTGC